VVRLAAGVLYTKTMRIPFLLITCFAKN